MSNQIKIEDIHKIYNGRSQIDDDDYNNYDEINRIGGKKSYKIEL